MKPCICVTIGDFNGIGPEVALKAASSPRVKRLCNPVLVGPYDVFEHVRKRLRLRTALSRTSLPVLPREGIGVVDVGDGIWADIQYGAITKTAGKTAGAAIERAVALCNEHDADAMVTAPVSKESLNLAGFNFPGQTEMVALLSRSTRFAMMLLTRKLRVALVTTHLPLREVAGQLSQQRIVEKALVVRDTLRDFFGIADPSVAVLGLNPHAGEGGVLGNEEQTVIAPAVAQLRDSGVKAEGPFPADGFFGARWFERFNAVLAMYHDQGLAPYKLLAFGQGVNYSAGLSILRTSPDHGTAADIAGKGKADPRSMIEAVLLAARLALKRRAHQQGERR